VTQNRAPATNLRELIHAYNDRFDERARKSLARLNASIDAAKAFEQLKCKNIGDGLFLLARYAQAEQLYREFRPLIAKWNKTLARMEKTPMRWTSCVTSPPNWRVSGTP
jgi:hypothetical protein